MPPPTFGLLLAEVGAQLPALSNRGFCQAAWALARLSPTLPPPPGAGAAADAVGARALPRAAPPPPAFVERFWQQAHLRSGRLAPGESTLLLWAVARLGLDAPPRWLAAELAQAQRALPTYRPDQLSNTLIALARMQRAPPAAWLAAFEAAAPLQAFTLQQLVDVAWALAALGAAPSITWQHAAVTELRAACAEGCGAREPLSAAEVGGLLAEAGLLGALGAAVAAQDTAEQQQRGDGGGAYGAAAAAALAARLERGSTSVRGGAAAADGCPLVFGFDLPLGAA